MRYFKQVPFLQILFFFITGILIAEYSGVWLLQINKLSILAFSICTIIIIAFAGMKKHSIVQILIPFIFLFSGFENYILQCELTKPNHFSKYPESKSGYLAGKIREIKKSKKGTSLTIELNHVERNDSIISLSGNLLIYTDIPYDNCNLGKDDVIEFPAKYSKISKNKNPLAFNPERYYHFQNIHYYSFLSSKEIKLIRKTHSQINSIFRKIKTNIIKNLQNAVEDTKARSIAIAIMLGDKHDLDKSILKKFSLTGIRHILTVSGMHVGIIALILNFLLSFIKFKNKNFPAIKILTILSGIWFYTLLSGAEPAVLRAAFMISLIMLGINIKKYINIFNILFGSALVILLFNPFQLFQLSFILSYTAMLSILMFYKPVYSFISLKNIRILDYLWQLISLSLAAQVLIFPLSIFYFHTGPSLFFITALISTPMAFATMTLGFFTSVLYFFSHYLSHLSGDVLSFLISNSLQFIDDISRISIDLGKFIYLSSIDTILIMLTIISFYAGFKLKIKFTRIFAYLITILFIANQVIFKFRNINNEMVIYSINKGILADFYIKDKVFSFKSGIQNEEDIIYAASNYRYSKGYFKKNNSDEANRYFAKKENVIRSSGKTLVILGLQNDFLPANNKRIDYLLIGGDINPDTLNIFNSYKINNIILGKSINYKIKKYWNNLAKKRNIAVWDISKKGAFISQLKANKDV